MKKILVPMSLTLALTCINGCLFDSDDKDDARKGSVSGRVAMIVTGEPVAGVKVMLVNRDAKVDSTNPDMNRAAFVDSAVTGADGSYAIDDITPGNYAVLPMLSDADSSAVYTFSPAAGSGTYEFTLDGDARTVSFIAEKTGYPGLTEHDLIGISVTFLNPDQCMILGLTAERRTWALFIPVWEKPEVLDDRIRKDHNDRYFIGQSFYKGYTALLWTVDNTWRFTVTYQKTNEIRDKTASFIISFPLGSAIFGEFTYDPLAGELKETGRTIY